MEHSGEFMAVKGVLKETFSTTTPYKRASFKIITEDDKELSVTYFGTTFMEDVMAPYKEDEVVVAGKMIYSAEYKKY